MFPFFNCSNARENDERIMQEAGEFWRNTLAVYEGVHPGITAGIEELWRDFMNKVVEICPDIKPQREDLLRLYEEYGPWIAAPRLMRMVSEPVLTRTQSVMSTWEDLFCKREPPSPSEPPEA